MVTAEQAKQLYAGKYFYEIVKTEDPKVLNLVGPLDTIRYAVNVDNKKILTVLEMETEFEFVQVIDGKIVQKFAKDEILVTNKAL